MMNLKSKLECSIKSFAVHYTPGSTLTQILCRMSMKMLYTDDLVILAERFEHLMTKMAIWKNGLESKGLKGFSFPIKSKI